MSDALRNAIDRLQTVRGRILLHLEAVQVHDSIHLSVAERRLPLEMGEAIGILQTLDLIHSAIAKERDELKVKCERQDAAINASLKTLRETIEMYGGEK